MDQQKKLGVLRSRAKFQAFKNTEFQAFKDGARNTKYSRPPLRYILSEGLFMRGTNIE